MTPDELERPPLPIRTRGALLRRDTPYRTRGAIPTSGAIRTHGGPDSGFPGPDLVDIANLIAQLRIASRNIPLVVVIHGCGTAPAGRFRTELKSSLWPEDAVWLVPAGPADAVEAPEAFVLDLNRANERRTYDNLVADVVFFQGTRDEIPDAPSWATRTQAAIACSAGPALGALLAALQAVPRRYVYGFETDPRTSAPLAEV